MGLDDISYATVSDVIESWELGRQSFACVETVGMSVMLKLFEMDPATKTLFGFRVNQDIASNPLARMGVLVHGENFMNSIDELLSLVGPDIDMLEMLLAEEGARHKKMGVKPEHILLMGEACRQALSEILPKEKWSSQKDAAWRELFAELSAEMIKSM